jgi:hemoglobin-like flavoprotein
MTPEQVTLVRQSMVQVRGRSRDFTADFYDRLFASEPDLRSMFSTDPVVQQEKFYDELETIVGAIGDIGTFLLRAGALGARHSGYGVRTDHYRIVRDALLEAFAAQLGEAWTPAHETAWRAAYDMVAEAMLMGRGGSAGQQRSWRAAAS